MPKPGKNESHDDFISRCIPIVLDDGTAKDQAQAVAICNSIWEDSKKSISRAHSVLEIKAVDEDLRILKGTATTPTPDRLGDIIEPLGVQVKNPIPLLWQHRSSEPVGTAILGKADKNGIRFEAKIPKIAEPGKLKERIDEAWQSIKIGLVKGVSIGFRAMDMSFMKDGGIRFLETEVMELSLVTIPANADATIEQIKAYDVYPPAKAEGAKPNPGAKIIPIKERIKSMTVLEQIAAFEAKRAASVARMDDLMKKAADEQQTLDENESKEYDDFTDEVKKIDTHLKRLHDLETANRTQAKPVNGNSLVHGSESRGNGSSLPARVSVKANVPQGTSFTRYAMALAVSKGNRWEALQIAKQWHDQTPEVELVLNHDIPAIMKAAVGVGTTTDATWASPLIAYQVMASEFIELLRPATIIGRIPGLRRVPFNIQMPRTTTGSTVGWVGENAPKPVTSMAFDTVQLRWAKAAGIIVLTDELVRFSNLSAEAIVRADMVDAMAQFLDRQFVDPTVAAVTNVSPASITNGVTATVRTGTNQAALSTDLQTLFGTFLSNNLSTAGGVWVMSQRQALALSLMLNALGQPFYPGITAEGGSLLGYPVVASENVPSVGNSPADGTPIIFLLPREIMLADDGQVVIDASNQASVQMDTAPDSPPTASTTLISLWQMNMTGLRAERWINWLKRRSTAVGYISNANYA
jgi:HK97 family phage major capsid protein/HK97 family phage prohead protease